MSGLNDALKGALTENEAGDILEGMSDFEILGGSFVGNDLKKKVRSLMRANHPDTLDHELVPEVRTAIIKRLGSVGDRNNSKGEYDSGASGENPGRDKQNARPQAREKSNSEINQEIQSIYDAFLNSNKSLRSCYAALVFLQDIENQHRGNLKITKTKVLELYSENIFEQKSKSSDEEIEREEELISGLAIEFNIDINEKIDKLKKNRGGKLKIWGFFKKKDTENSARTDVSKVNKENSNDYESLLRTILQDYRSAPFKSSAFQTTMQKLEAHERQQRVNLKKEKTEVIALYVEEIMREYRISAFKSSAFKATMQKLESLERQQRKQRVNLKKEKTEVIALYVEEIMREYRTAAFKSGAFKTTMQKLESLERQQRVNLKKEKTVAIALYVQEIMTEYQSSFNKTNTYNDTMRKLKGLEKNYGAKLAREKDRVEGLKDK